MTLVPVATAAALLGPALVLFLVLQNLQELMVFFHYRLKNLTPSLLHAEVMLMRQQLLPQLDQASALAR
jgi:hypothetical protein